MLEALGTHQLPATVTMLLRMWFLNVWDNVPMDLKYVYQQYFTCICFLGFIRYNKIFITWGFRKYENLFTHEYHIPLGRCPWEIWYSWVNKFSYFPQFRVPLTFSRGFRRGGIWYLYHGIWFVSCVITCSDFYLLSNQINLFMVINIWGIITLFIRWNLTECLYLCLLIIPRELLNVRRQRHSERINCRRPLQCCWECGF
jgi:hypothetical protein